MYTRKYKFRLGLVTLIFIFLLTLICIRIIYIQLARHGEFSFRADNQHCVRVELEPKRGSILDRNTRNLAVNLRADSVYAVARDIDKKDKERVASLLAPILNKDKSFLLERLSRDKLFVWLARKITSEQAQKIKKLKIEGIYLIDETKRSYPNGDLACQIIGFCDTDNMGIEGIERHYDKYLHGKEGYKFIIRDAKRREIFAYDGINVPPVDGCSITLTIDEVIQHITQKALKKVCQKYNGRAGVAIVMDPYNGDILALAVEPSYDLNNFAKASKDAKRNRAITDYYEPGSVFKAFTAAACLEEKKVSPQDKFFCENGAWYVAGHTLHDYHGYGTLTFREIIINSSNIGTVKTAMKLGDKLMEKYVRLFGFGTLTGVDLPGEIQGKVRALKYWTKYSMTAIPMGQEIGVTPLQLTCAMSAIANNGLLIKPRIINKIVDSKGELIKEYKPVIVRRVISEQTCQVLKPLLKGVVEEGTGKSSRLKNYECAGKTGTSQKIEPSGRYSQDKFIASFVGFAPVEKPVLTICVMVDEPQPIHFGGVVSAPAFKDIAEGALSYLGVAPERKP